MNVFLTYAAAIGVGDQRADDDATRHCSLQATRDLLQIEPKNQDVDRLLRLLDGGRHRRETGVRLNDELHHPP